MSSLNSWMFDETLCWQISWVLLHSFWQIGLLAIVARIVEVAICSRKAERAYDFYVGVLIVSALSLPLNLCLQSGDSARSAKRPLMPRRMTIAAVEDTQVPFPAVPRVSGFEISREPVRPATPGVVPASAMLSDTGTDWAWFSPYIVSGYAAGVLIMLSRLVWGSHQIRGLVNQATRIRNKQTQAIFDKACDRLGVALRPSLQQTESLDIPIVVGLWKPTILLPTSVIIGLPPAQIELILAHELAHVNRLDLWINLVQRIIEAILFFNPAIWFINYRINILREYCCDDSACQLSDTNTNQLNYAEALLRVVELSRSPQRVHVATGVAADGNRPSELRRRIRRLFEGDSSDVRFTRSTSIGTLAAVVGSLMLLPIGAQSLGEANDVQQPTQAETTLRATQFPTESNVASEESSHRDPNVVADLRDANVDADLRDANVDADLRDANVDADLRDANVDADLRDANVDADLRDANVDADLRDANVDADLRDASLGQSDPVSENPDYGPLAVQSTALTKFNDALSGVDAVRAIRLMEDIAKLKEQHEQSMRLQSQDREGGEDYNVAKAKLDWECAVAELLLVKGRNRESSKAYQRAYQTANEYQELVESAHGEGTLTREQAKMARQRRKSIRRQLSAVSALLPILRFKVFDADGKQEIANPYVTIWRELAPFEDDPVNTINGTNGFGYYDPVIWEDRANATRWIRIRSGNTVRGLDPGFYRLTAMSHAAGTKTPDPTPYGISPPFRYNGEQSKTISFNTQSGNCDLKIRMVNDATGLPVKDMAIRLFDAGGAPIVHGHGSGNFFEWADDDGEIRYQHLRPGKHRVQILGLQSKVNKFVEYPPIEEFIDVDTNPGSRTMTIRVPSRRLTQKEIDERFPFSVTGRVTDTAGNPLSGVKVKASTGIGTLLGGASVFTGKDGRYVLYFGPGMRVMNTPKGVGTQAVHFRAMKDGWESTSDLGYQFWLMSDMTEPEFAKMLREKNGYWDKKNTDEVVFCNDREEVNFVLKRSELEKQD